MAVKSDVFRAQLRAHAASMLARFSEVSSFEHRLVRGMARETPIRQYLEKHLPARIGVGTGTVVSVDETPNTQHDIVLFDRDFSGPILFDETASAYPVETVHGIVEIKSGPDLRLEEVAASLSKIRELSRRKGVRGNEGGTTRQGVHMVVSYRGPRKETLLEQMEQANAAHVPTTDRLAIDMVLVLSTGDSHSIETGYLLGFSEVVGGSDQLCTQYYPKRGLTPSCLAEGHDVFARWLTHLINHLNGCCCYPPPLFVYFGFDYRIVDHVCHAEEMSR